MLVDPWTASQVLPPFPEGPGRRGGKITNRSPARPRSRQSLQPPLPGQGSQDQARAAQGQQVEPRAPQDFLPEPVSQSFPAPRLDLVLQLAQADQHLRNMDLY